MLESLRRARWNRRVRRCVESGFDAREIPVGLLDLAKQCNGAAPDWYIRVLRRSGIVPMSRLHLLDEVGAKEESRALLDGLLSIAGGDQSVLSEHGVRVEGEIAVLPELDLRFALCVACSLCEVQVWLDYRTAVGRPSVVASRDSGCGVEWVPIAASVEELLAFRPRAVRPARPSGPGTR